uniref:nucleotidyltransferase family protein n=1 Tax=Bordetella sputigena TaxID=1416810 RepID=UPI0039EFC926
MGIIEADPHRRSALQVVRDLRLPDCWIGAGFVRTAVWDSLLGRPADCRGDIDVIWFDSQRACPLRDVALQAQLSRAVPQLGWSVKNQSRMHERNGDGPYTSSFDAIKRWPETATAVAVRLNDNAGIEVLAPFGLQDLFEGIIRPTPRFACEKQHIFDQRYVEKGWLHRWPFLRVIALTGS